MSNQPDDWHSRAKCYNQPLSRWLPDILSLDRATRHLEAQAKCSGCPVFRECGREALQFKDSDVIRAGHALVDPGERAVIRRQYVSLEQQLEVQRYPSWPRPCETCQRPMRPAGEDPEKWPDTTASHSRKECATCRRVRRHGSVGIPA